MAKLLALDDAFRPEFIELLRGGLTFGPLLAMRRDLYDGTLAVWVPESVSDVKVGKLKYDLLDHPETFGLDVQMHSFFDGFFSRTLGGILIVDTPTDASNEAGIKRLQHLPWFSCESPRAKRAKLICLFLTKDNASLGMYDEVMRWSHWYPTTLVLSSLPEALHIKLGEHYESNSDLICQVLDRTAHVLLGVFDERSMLVWSTSAPETLSRP